MTRIGRGVVGIAIAVGLADGIGAEVPGRARRGRRPSGWASPPR